MVKKRRGKFIVVDGCDGSGKTTVLEGLRNKFKQENTLITKEPGGTVFADKIRELILSDDAKNTDSLTMFNLFWASRSEHMNNKVIPALQKGIDVITDRFDSATFAYQIYGEKRKKLEDLFWQTRKLALGKFEPDLYIFLDLPPKETMRRIKRRGGKQNHFDKRAEEYHKRVRSGIKIFAKKVPSVIIDATKPREGVLEDA